MSIKVAPEGDLSHKPDQPWLGHLGRRLMIKDPTRLMVSSSSLKVLQQLSLRHKFTLIFGRFPSSRRTFGDTAVRKSCRLMVKAIDVEEELVRVADFCRSWVPPLATCGTAAQKCPPIGKETFVKLLKDTFSSVTTLCIL